MQPIVLFLSYKINSHLEMQSIKTLMGEIPKRTRIFKADCCLKVHRSNAHLKLTSPISGISIQCRGLLSFFFTPTANAESWAAEAFSLCVFTSTKLSERSPMERRAPAQSSSRDQCT